MKLVELFEQSLQEISMSPSSLQAFANSAQAQGILVGFEAELVVPIEGGMGDELDIGPDYDQDERCYDIEQIVNFFQQGDNPLSPREAAELHDELGDDFMEWLNEIVYEKFLDIRDDNIRELANQDGLTEPEIQEIMDNPGGRQYQQYEWQAQDELRDEIYRDYTESDWLRAQGYRNMTDIETAYNLSWPHITSPDGNPDAIYDVARDIKRDLGVPVNASKDYHGASREPGRWVLEPDSSIRTPDDSEYAGLELITPSPPFPLGQSLEWIDKVFDWARNYGCLTNASTGFHISVSLPEQTTRNIDWIKLVLFLGDKYVLEQYGRQANSYTVSAIDRMQSYMDQHPNFPVQQALDAMRNGLMNLASQIVSRPSENKYTSVNVKTKYVEFRSAGGNYLENQQQIKLTMLRYVRAIAIAADPNTEKQEYATKLYKLLNPTGANKQATVINLFSRFSSGMIDKNALKQQLRALGAGQEKE
jgi:hypothetical protein